MILAAAARPAAYMAAEGLTMTDEELIASLNELCRSPGVARLRAWLWALEVLGHSGRPMVASTEDSADASDG